MTTSNPESRHDKTIPIIWGITILICITYWFLDALWTYTHFEANLRYMVFKQPLTILDAVLLKVNSFQKVSRIATTIAFFLFGLLTAVFFRRQKRTEHALRQSEERFRGLVENLRHDYFFYRHDTKGVFSYLSPSVADVIGYSPGTAEKHYGEFLTPNPINKQVYDFTAKSVEGIQQPPYLAEVRHKDGHPLLMEIFERPIFDMRGSVIAVEGLAHDITRYEAAREKIQTALNEKEILLRELYHRTKNNMQVICSLLALQANFIDEPKLLAILDETASRIQTMALVHQKLYQSGNLASIDLAEYVKDLCNSLIQTQTDTHAPVSLHLDIENMDLPIETAIPFGLVLNELITNSLKHGLHDVQNARIDIQVCKTADDRMQCTFRDNGKGFPAGFDFRQVSSLGLTLVRDITEQQLHGQISVKTAKGAEIRLLLDFNQNNKKER